MAMTIFSACEKRAPPAIGGDLHRVRVREAAGPLDDRDAEAVEQVARLRRLDEPDLPLVPAGSRRPCASRRSDRSTP